MFVIRLLVYLGLISVVVAVAMFLLTRDVRYLRFAGQVFKFFLVFLLVFAVLMMAGSLIFYRI